MNTEHVKEAGQAKGQEQEKVLEVPGACCQKRSSKSVRKNRDSEEETTEQEITGKELDDEPVENKFDVLVEALKKLIKLSSLDDVKKALKFVESDLLIDAELKSPASE